MFRRLRFAGVTALLVMTIGVVAYGEAVSPQARSGNNLLKTAGEPRDASQRVVQTNSLAASFSKNTAFAPSAAKGTAVMTFNSGTTEPCPEDDGGCGPAPAGAPEPFSMVLLGTGLAGLAAMMRKRR